MYHFLFVVRKLSFGKIGYGDLSKKNPLIRKVNGDNEIEGLNIGIKGDFIDKVCGYADDIVFIIKECNRSIKKLFKTYHSFSKI